MANQLGMADQQAILALAARKWSYRRIAQELGVHRETVARHVKRAREQPASTSPCDVHDPPPPGWDPRPVHLIAGSDGSEPSDLLTGSDSKPAKVIAGSEDQKLADATVEDPKPANVITGFRLRRTCRSQCEPFREVILQALERSLSAQRIWQDLRCEHGFTASYLSVQRFVRRLRGTRPLPFRRMECAPGEEAQIDFGKGAPVAQPNGKRRRPHGFRIVLSYSRKAYSEAVYRQTTEDFLRCLENAFWSFGGVPKTLVIDNLKAAVTKADWYDPELNPKILSFCRYYGTVILPSKSYTPRHKGKIERGVGYFQDNAMKDRRFKSLEAENQFLREWETSVADTRIHGTTRRQVGKVFEEEERSALQPLPVGRFPAFQEAPRSVHRDAHVEVAKAYYSVPPEYVGRRVWVRWDSHMIRVFNQQFTQIAVHARQEPGRFSTQDRHIASQKISRVERGATWMLEQARKIGVQAGCWGQALLEHRGIEGLRVLNGLLSLASRHPSGSIEKACEVAHSHGAYRLRDIRNLLDRQAPSQDRFAFIDQHAIIRSLSEYGQLVHTAIRHDPHRESKLDELWTSIKEEEVSCNTIYKRR